MFNIIKIVRDTKDKLQYLNLAITAVLTIVFLATFANIAEADSYNFEVIDTIFVESWPTGAAISPDGNKLVVVNSNLFSSPRQGSVSVIDIETSDVITIPLGLGYTEQTAVTPNSELAYIAVNNRLDVVDLRTNTLLNPVTIASGSPNASGIGITAFTSDSALAYATNRNDDTVAVIDVDQNSPDFKDIVGAIELDSPGFLVFRGLPSAYVYITGGVAQGKVFVIEKSLVNNPPTFSGYNQYKSDATTTISEGAITTEEVIIFKANVVDPDNDQVGIEVELRQSDEPFTGEYDGGILVSELVDSGTEANIVKDELDNGQYHWRMRAIDSYGAVSEWEEFGEEGNVDFEAKTVPLYTQILSQYPSVASTTEWSREQYGNGGIGGYAEYKITLNNTDNYTLIVNGKDDEAADSKTSKKITAKVNACLYKIKDKYGDPICIAEKILSWPVGDNQYKSVSVTLGRIIADNYFFRLTSKEDYFDINNLNESGDLNVYLD